MNRHSFRWRGLTFGLFFLSVAGTWSIWRQDLLTQQQFSLAVSGVLIVLGTLGVIATFWRPSASTLTTTEPITTEPITNQEERHEAPDPQP